MYTGTPIPVSCAHLTSSLTRVKSNLAAGGTENGAEASGRRPGETDSYKDALPKETPLAEAAPRGTPKQARAGWSEPIWADGHYVRGPRPGGVGPAST